MSETEHNNTMPKVQKNSVVVNKFYEYLLDSIKVLSIACADEAGVAPTDTKDRRKPILVLWKSILSDLCSIQSVFEYGVSLGILDLGSGAINPGSAITEWNAELNSIAVQLGETETKLNGMHQLWELYQVKAIELQKLYADISPQIQLQEAARDALLAKQTASRDLGLLAATIVAKMEAAMRATGKKPHMGTTAARF